MGRPHKCPYCGQSRSISKGIRRTKTMGDRCIRLCKACRRKFTPKCQPERDVPNAETEIVPETPSQPDEGFRPVEMPTPMFQSASDLVGRGEANDRPA